MDKGWYGLQPFYILAQFIISAHNFFVQIGLYYINKHQLLFFFLLKHLEANSKLMNRAMGHAHVDVSYSSIIVLHISWMLELKV